MITDAEIIAVYLVAEKAAGGPSSADVLALCIGVAHLLGLTYSRVRDAMSAHWSCGGAG